MTEDKPLGEDVQSTRYGDTEKDTGNHPASLIWAYHRRIEQKDQEPIEGLALSFPGTCVYWKEGKLWIEGEISYTETETPAGTGGYLRRAFPNHSYQFEVNPNLPHEAWEPARNHTLQLRPFGQTEWNENGLVWVERRDLTSAEQEELLAALKGK